jgi:hypothetical protein
MRKPLLPILSILLMAATLVFGQDADTNTEKSITPKGPEYWRARLDAARQITMFNTRDGAMAGIAEDAASQGVDDVATQALNEITNFMEKDKAAQTVALKLAEAGKPAAANRAAELINNLSTRDEVLAKLAKGEFTVANSTPETTTFTVTTDNNDGLAVVAVVAGILVVLALVTLTGVLYLLTLQRALERCAPEVRAMKPAMVWLMLIPLCNIVWQFVVVLRVSRSLGAEFARRGVPEHEAPGKGVGLAMCICACLTLALPIAFILWIVYWVRIAGCAKRLKAPSPPVIPPGMAPAN